VINTLKTAAERQQTKWKQSVGLDSVFDDDEEGAGRNRPRQSQDQTSNAQQFYDDDGRPTATSPSTAVPLVGALTPLPSDDKANRIEHSTKIQAFHLQFPNPLQTGTWITAHLPLPREWVHLGFTSSAPTVSSPPLQALRAHPPSPAAAGATAQPPQQQQQNTERKPYRPSVLGGSGPNRSPRSSRADSSETLFDPKRLQRVRSVQKS
jgi:hypothetical protein